MNVLRLIPEQGGEGITIDQEKARIGRDPASDVRLRDASISRLHAEIRREGEDWVIVDLNSANGIRVEEQPVSRAVLEPGQTLRLGSVCFRVDIDRGDLGSTVVMRRSPIARESPAASLGGPIERPRPSAQPPFDRTAVLLVFALVVGGVLLVSLGVILALSLSNRGGTASARQAAMAPAAPRSERTGPTPTPAPPTPEPTLKVMAPEGALVPTILLVSSDSQAALFVDDRRAGSVAAGGVRRIEVSPGKHIVTFHAGTLRHSEVVRAQANEQTVVRFSAAAQVVAPAAGTSPAQAPPSNAIAVLSPLAAVAPSSASEPAPAPPSATPVTEAAPSLPAPPRPSDEAVRQGAAAAARGDFFRAVLVLKDATRRLEEDPKATRDLARAYAYLAWSYQGLERPEDARAAAEKAVKADPDVASGLSGFPASAMRLFKRSR